MHKAENVTAANHRAENVTAANHRAENVTAASHKAKKYNNQLKKQKMLQQTITSYCLYCLFYFMLELQEHG